VQNLTEGSVSFDWEGIQATFLVSGATTVSATLRSTFLTSPPPTEEEEKHTAPSAPRSLQSSSYPKYTVYRVYVDGVRQNGDAEPGGLLLYPTPSETFTLVTGLDPTTPHTVSLYYSTDPVYDTWPNVSCVGCVQSVLGFGTDGSFGPSPPPPLPRKLLFIGDSITAGNGFYRSQCNPPNASSCDLSMSYGSLLCQAFGANCTTLAVSSKGLMVNCCDNLPVTVPDFAQRTLAQDPRPELLWDWSSFVPDAVIVALGTNDSGHDSGPAWEAAFSERYALFMYNLTVAMNKPSMPFFTAVGPITERYAQWVVNANQIAASKYGITATSYVNFTGATLDGCGHPGPQGHAEMFEIAKPVLAKVLGW
jgi:lysophospholipase L1-like esterase